jgi:hypothetical protein
LLPFRKTFVCVGISMTIFTDSSTVFWRVVYND